MSNKLVKSFYICNGNIPECAGSDHCGKECHHTTNKNYTKYNINDKDRKFKSIPGEHNKFRWEYAEGKAYQKESR